MLKVLKHEFMETGRIIIIIYGLSLLLGGITNILSVAVPESLTGNYGVGNMFVNVFSMLSGMGLAAIMGGTIVILCNRFSNAILGKATYFTYSLPVKNYVHILARVINTAIYSVIMVLASALQLFMMIGFQNLSSTFSHLNAADVISVIMFVICLFIVIFICFIMSIYAAMTLGTLFTKNKMWGMIISLFIFNTVGSIITSFIILPFWQPIFELMNFVSGIGNIYGRLWVIFALFTAVEAIFAAIYYTITWYMSCRRLNIGN